MKSAEISGKKMIINKMHLVQLLDQINQIKSGLLYALDAVECAGKSSDELNKEKQAKDVN